MFICCKKLIDLSNKQSDHDIMTACYYVEKVIMPKTENSTFEGFVIIDAGVGLKDIVDEMNKLTINEQEKKNILKSSLDNFLDTIAKINEEYIHLDLKIENVVYEYTDDTGLKINLIDLDMISNRIKFCNDPTKEYQCGQTITTCIVPIEYVWYYYKDTTHINTIELIKNDFAKNKKSNYIGIFSIIFSTLTEILWVTFLSDIFSKMVFDKETDTIDEKEKNSHSSLASSSSLLLPPYSSFQSDQDLIDYYGTSLFFWTIRVIDPMNPFSNYVNLTIPILANDFASCFSFF